MFQEPFSFGLACVYDFFFFFLEKQLMRGISSSELLIIVGVRPVGKTDRLLVKPSASPIRLSFPFLGFDLFNYRHLS